ncbi:hypothetical protein [Paenibacillus wulumuqiensis]|uniref:hypothetical protein n=1 Tax=Paenibacillus wulumuqiensis TaxID=1567107 RepID=UPI0006194859|nr:hypothetical protein [Paenibacillus wulumuqiensis]
MSKTDRYQQMMEQTRIRFLQDAGLKMEDLRIRFHTYHGDPSPAGIPELQHAIHRHAHAIKGLALILSYEEMDEVCGDILAIVLQEPPRDCSLAEMEHLHRLVLTLEHLLEKASS